MRIFICCLFIIHCFFLQGESISDKTTYPEFCQMAAEDNSLFINFKRNPVYRLVLEHVTYEQGLQYLEIIKNEYPDLLPYFPKFKENDLLGNPITFNYEGIGDFSPTTLRYIKVAGDLRKKFGNMDSFHIVEIGGGYGGQCKIFSDVCNFGSYTLIDLAPCNKLSKKYLDLLNVKNVFFIDNIALKKIETCDLCISNYAFSEVHENEQIEYLDKVLRGAKRGYMTCNFISLGSNINSLSTERVLEYLNSYNRIVSVEKENPLTHPDNILIIWDHL